MSEVAPDHAAAGGESFGGAVKRMFDGLAPRYDSFNAWASLGMDRGWRRVAIEMLAPPADGRVLDVATGTGDVAFAARARCGRVVAYDFAPEMIAQARAKQRQRAATDGVAFQVASADAMPYRSGTFDGVISAFAMRNVRPVLDEVLAEAFRVLAPGGRLVILEFTVPASGAVRWGHGLYTRTVVPRIGRWLTGSSEPFDYLNRSIDGWERPDEFARRLEGHGLEGVEYRALSLGTVAVHRGSKPASQ